MRSDFSLNSRCPGISSMCMFVCIVVVVVVVIAITYSTQPGKVDNPARGQKKKLPVPVRAREFGLAKRVWQSRPA